MRNTKLQGAGILGIAMIIFGWFLSGIIAAGSGRSGRSGR